MLKTDIGCQKYAYILGERRMRVGRNQTGDWWHRPNAAIRNIGDIVGKSSGYADRFSVERTLRRFPFPATENFLETQWSRSFGRVQRIRGRSIYSDAVADTRLMLRPGRGPGFVSNCGREIRFTRRHCANTCYYRWPIENWPDRSFHSAHARDTRRRPASRYADRIAVGMSWIYRWPATLETGFEGKRNVWKFRLAACENKSRHFFRHSHVDSSEKSPRVGSLRGCSWNFN